MSAAGWACTPRGRRELLAVGLFCLTFAVTPLLTTELYPFSRAPMFADAPRLYCDYTIYAPGEYTGYAAVVIPGVNEAIDAKDANRTRQQLAVLAEALDRAAQTLASAGE